MEQTAATPPRAATASTDIATVMAGLRRKLWHVVLLFLALWIPASIFIGWLAVHLAQHGGVPVAKLLLAVVGMVAVNIAIPFAVTFWATARLAGAPSRTMLWCLAALWAVALGGATLALAGQATALGWHGVGWIRGLGGVAIFGGIPMGIACSSRWMAARQTSRDRVAEFRAERAEWQADYDARKQYSDEVSLTNAAIRKWSGNHASLLYSIDASERLKRLLASDEMAETNPGRIALLQAFRAKVDAGVMPIV